MPDGGQLTVGLCQADSGLEVRVKDTGTGIPPDIRAKNVRTLFSPPGEMGPKERDWG